MNYLAIRSPVAVLTIVIFSHILFAEDAILKQAAERCARFETEVQDMRMVQKMTSVGPNGDQLTFEQTVFTKGQRTRIEMKMPLAEYEGGSGPGSLETIMVNDGTHAWVFSPLGEKKQLTEEEARLSAPARNCWGYFPDNARVTGSEEAQGRDCYIVELEEEGVRTKLWLDQHNFVPLQGETRDSTGTENYRWTHSDFHTIHGDWEYPFKTEMYAGDSLAATMIVTSLDVNQGLPDALFDPDSVHVPPVNLEELMKMMTAPEDSDSTK